MNAVEHQQTFSNYNQHNNGTYIFPATLADILNDNPLKFSYNYGNNNYQSASHVVNGEMRDVIYEEEPYYFPDLGEVPETPIKSRESSQRFHSDVITSYQVVDEVIHDRDQQAHEIEAPSPINQLGNHVATGSKHRPHVIEEEEDDEDDDQVIEDDLEHDQNQINHQITVPQSPEIMSGDEHESDDNNDDDDDDHYEYTDNDPHLHQAHDGEQGDDEDVESVLDDSILDDEYDQDSDVYDPEDEYTDDIQYTNVNEYTDCDEDEDDNDHYAEHNLDAHSDADDENDDEEFRRIVVEEGKTGVLGWDDNHNYAPTEDTITIKLSLYAKLLHAYRPQRRTAGKRSRSAFMSYQKPEACEREEKKRRTN